MPLHDVWAVDLPGGGPDRDLSDLRPLLTREALQGGSPAVRALFSLRRGLGRLLDWDREPARDAGESFESRLSAADREATRVEPGSPDGPFRALYASERESISEARNATVHAFLVYCLMERATGYRMYLAVYVRPVGRITGWYMRAIDPFRRRIVYPTLLRRVREAWEREVAAKAPIPPV